MAQIKKQKARRFEEILQNLKWQLKHIHIRTHGGEPIKGILSQIHGFAAAKPSVVDHFADAAFQKRVQVLIGQVERQMSASSAPAMA